MAVGELIVSLLAETGSFETDTKRAGDQLVKLEKIVKQLQKTMSDSYQGSEKFIGPLQPNKLRPAVDSVENLNRAVQKSQAGFRGANQVIQNTSYQITDFIVQVSGGVSAMRAFSQQAPQFLGAFGGTGAILGIVAALGGALADLVIKMNDTKSAADVFKELEDRAGKLGTVSKDAFNVDLSSLGKAYREANAEGKALIDANVTLQLQLIELSKIDAMANFKQGIKSAMDDVNAFRLSLLDITERLIPAWKQALKTPGDLSGFIKKTDVENFAALKEIGTESASSIDKARKAFGEGTISAGTYVKVLGDVLKATKDPSKELVAYVIEQQNFANSIARATGETNAYSSAQKNLYRGLEDNSKAAEKFTDRVSKLREKLNELTFGQIGTSELGAFNERYSAGAEKVTAQQATVLRGIYAQIDAQKTLNEENKTIESLNASYDSYGTKLQKIYDEQLKIYELQDAGRISQEKANTLIAGTQKAIDDLNDGGLKLARTMEQAFGQAIQQGVSGLVDVFFEANQSFSQFAANFLTQIAKMITQMMLLKAIEGGLNAWGFGSTSNQFPNGPVTTPLPSAKGNVFDGVARFAKGGTFTNSIVSRPTMFAYGGAFGSQAGVMGEAGPEAVMPLKRDASGRLGVQGNQSNVSIVVNNNSSNAQATATSSTDSFGNRQIEILVADMVNKAISTGKTDSAMRNAYNIRRSGK